MTFIEALGTVFDLASENALREDQISDDMHDPLWGELAKQQDALALVRRFAAILEEE